MSEVRSQKSEVRSQNNASSNILSNLGVDFFQFPSKWKMTRMRNLGATPQVDNSNYATNYLLTIKSIVFEIIKKQLLMELSASS